MADQAPRVGTRMRRRGLYGPPPRLTRTSPLVGRLVWHIGDWGRASEHIGGRWEVVAGPLARQRLDAGDQLVVLAADPELMAAVLTSGLAHADALRAWRENGHLALEPLDFKWSLETASARQVSGETLTRLLDSRLPRLESELIDVRARLDLERRLAARKLLEERLAQIPRAAYPFGRLRTDLAKEGTPRQVLDSRGALGRAYGEVTRELASAIRQAGYSMTTSGLSPETALD